MLGSQLIKMFGADSESGLVLSDEAVFGTTYAQWTLGSDGFTYARSTSGAAVKSLAWINPQSGMNLFEVRATVLSGNVPPGTIGAWLNAGASQTWGWTAQATTKSCNLGIEIRRISDSVVVGTATITLEVDGLA